jgi:hypothetical protein
MFGFRALLGNDFLPFLRSFSETVVSVIQGIGRDQQREL